jgi:TDG/mug DNA glycosylase family protein
MFCGINPSVYSVVAGHHFARPGNRFWKALHGGGFTPHLFHPSQDIELIHYGCGITNVAARSSAAAAELSTEELIEGGKLLTAKMQKFKPRWLAVLGISAYRVAFNCPEAKIGLQQERIASTRIWVLPNPSGLNAHYRVEDLARLFGELRAIVQNR